MGLTPHKMKVLLVIVFFSNLANPFFAEKNYYNGNFVNVEQSLLLQFYYDPTHREYRHCNLYESRKEVLRKLSKLHESDIQVVNDQQLNLLSEICKYVIEMDANDITSATASFPGTKWCGIGNTARGYHDLGIYQKADECCRKHDFCPDVIKGGETKHGISNFGIGIMSHCSCDMTFYSCLQAAADDVADIIGILFFNIFKMRCFMYEHTVQKCTKYYGRKDPVCQQYMVDRSKSKSYQLFDPMHYFNNNVRARK